MSGCSAWTSGLQTPVTSNLFQHPQDYESDPFLSQDDSISNRGDSSKEMFCVDTPNIFETHGKDGRTGKKSSTHRM